MTTYQQLLFPSVIGSDPIAAQRQDCPLGPQATTVVYILKCIHNNLLLSTPAKG